MARYAFHDLTLEVQQVEEKVEKDLGGLLHDLSWDETSSAGGTASLSLSVRLSDASLRLPPASREVLQTDSFRGLESEGDFYLTDGASLLHLEPSKGQGRALLASSFFLKPPRLRHDFWAFGLLKLLRPMGIYGLHAAGLVAPDGTGFLVVGESGAGKSTMTIALIRRGWGYLSDDAVLLRGRADGVEALALRRHFYVDGASAAEYADLPFGLERPDRHGGQRQRVGIEAAYPAHRVSAYTPKVLLFPRVVPGVGSARLPVDRPSALRLLIAQSGPQLFDRATTAEHFSLLKALLQQTTSYELHAGSDLYRDPDTLADLLTGAEGEKPCPASS